MDQIQAIREKQGCDRFVATWRPGADSIQGLFAEDKLPNQHRSTQHLSRRGIINMAASRGTSPIPPIVLGVLNTDSVYLLTLTAASRSQCEWPQKLQPKTVLQRSTGFKVSLMAPSEDAVS
ncbi:unnamed protein product [Pleuronectes platessa]|uniref:Uncharacterized protein n=1 Tax=Pleuronectes platessa TaxID=8262 RepID=A0A9N7VFT1_PLEPL|nr:unnamed protein product [Pleuronectes platessa]